MLTGAVVRVGQRAIVWGLRVGTTKVDNRARAIVVGRRRQIAGRGGVRAAADDARLVLNHSKGAVVEPEGVGASIGRWC